MRSAQGKSRELVLPHQPLRLDEHTATQPRPARWEQVVVAGLAAQVPMCRG